GLFFRAHFLGQLRHLQLPVDRDRRLQRRDLVVLAALGYTRNLLIGLRARAEVAGCAGYARRRCRRLQPSWRDALFFGRQRTGEQRAGPPGLVGVAAARIVGLRQEIRLVRRLRIRGGEQGDVQRGQAGLGLGEFETDPEDQYRVEDQ